MVKKTKGLYQWEECKLLYEDESWAEKCEAWCKEHNSCNIEVIKHSIKLQRQDKKE